MINNIQSSVFGIRLEDFSVGGIVKWFVVAGLLMYVFFAIVVVRQTMVMTETVEGEVNWLVKLLGWLHLGIAILLVVLAVIGLP